MNTLSRHWPYRIARHIGLAASLALTAVPAAQAKAAGRPAGGQSAVVGEELLAGLDSPWSLAFLPGNAGILITGRQGRLLLWTPATGLYEAIGGVPAVYERSQGGLLDIALAPDFTESRRVYLSYAEKGEGRMAGTAVGYGTLSSDARKLSDFTVVFRQLPKLSTGAHFGSRLVFDKQGHLFIALGENNQRPTAQDLDKLQGKIVRLNPDGSVPAGNPFTRKEG